MPSRIHGPRCDSCSGPLHAGTRYCCPECERYARVANGCVSLRP